MYCIGCGEQLGEDDHFCGHCGRSAFSLPTAPDPPPPPALPSPFPPASGPPPVAYPPPRAAHVAEVGRGGTLDAASTAPASAAPPHPLPLPAAANFAFAEVDAAPGAFEPFRLRWAERYWLLPDSGERLVARWLCVSIHGFEIAAPGEGSRGDSGVTQVFNGPGMLVLTDRRVAGMAYLQVGAAVQPVALFQFPLAELEQVAVNRNQRMLGLEERGITLHTPRSALFADLDRTVGDNKVAKRGSPREGMILITRTALQARGADPDSVAFDADDDDIIVRFSDPPGGEPAAIDREPRPDLSPTSETWSCEACRSPLELSAQFCSQCGLRVSDQSAAEPPALAAAFPPETSPPPPPVLPPPSPPAYGPPPGGYPPPGIVPVQQQTNGLAIASLVLGIVWLYWIGSILALVFGYVAKGQIDRSQGYQSGSGMAIAGIVLGWVGLAILLILVIVGVSLRP